jgi:hypothetical protein
MPAGGEGTMSRATIGPEDNADTGLRSVGLAREAEPTGKPKEPTMSNHSSAAELKSRDDANDPLTFEFAVPGSWSAGLATAFAELMEEALQEGFPLSSRYARTQHPSKSNTSSTTCERSSKELAWHRHRP